MGRSELVEGPDIALPVQISRRPLGEMAKKSRAHSSDVLAPPTAHHAFANIVGLCDRLLFDKPFMNARSVLIIPQKGCLGRKKSGLSRIRTGGLLRVRETS